MHITLYLNVLHQFFVAPMKITKYKCKCSVFGNKKVLACMSNTNISNIYLVAHCDFIFCAIQILLLTYLILALTVQALS